MLPYYVFAENSPHTRPALFRRQHRIRSSFSECTAQMPKTPPQLHSFPTLSKRVRNSLNPWTINCLYFAIHAHSLAASHAFSMTSQKQTVVYSPLRCQLEAPDVHNSANSCAINLLAEKIPNPALLPTRPRNFAFAATLCIL
jgi:hypothetical protein